MSHRLHGICLTHLSVDVSGKRVDALDVGGGALETILCIEKASFAGGGGNENWFREMNHPEIYLQCT